MTQNKTLLEARKESRFWLVNLFYEDQRADIIKHYHEWLESQELPHIDYYEIKNEERYFINTILTNTRFIDYCYEWNEEECGILLEDNDATREYFETDRDHFTSNPNFFKLLKQYDTTNTIK